MNPGNGPEAVPSLASRKAVRDRLRAAGLATGAIAMLASSCTADPDSATAKDVKASASKAPFHGELLLGEVMVLPEPEGEHGPDVEVLAGRTDL